MGRDAICQRSPHLTDFTKTRLDCQARRKAIRLPGAKRIGAGDDQSDLRPGDWRRNVKDKKTCPYLLRGVAWHTLESDSSPVPFVAGPKGRTLCKRFASSASTRGYAGRGGESLIPTGSGSPTSPVARSTRTMERRSGSGSASCSTGFRRCLPAFRRSKRPSSRPSSTATPQPP